MQRLWLIEATKYNAVPLDDRGFERINPDIAGRPQPVTGNTQLLFPGMRVSEGCTIVVKNKSHSVTANQWVISADEATDVGGDTGSPASPDYGPTGNKFTGRIQWVQIDIGDDDHNQLITAEDRFKIAMARQ